MPGIKLNEFVDTSVWKCVILLDWYCVQEVF